MSDTQMLLFDLPTTPDEVAVAVPPAKLRRIDFSSLDWSTSLQAQLEYIKTYYPNAFNDFVAADGVVIFADIVAGICAKLALRADMLSRGGFIGPAQTTLAVSELLRLIGQAVQRQTPANVDIQVALDSAQSVDVPLPAGLIMEGTGGQIYELYNAPGDFTNPIVVPAGKRGVIAFGLQGQFATPVTRMSAGGPKQTYAITGENILSSPVIVTVTTGDTVENWASTPLPLVLYGPTAKVVNVSFIDTDLILTFGDDVNGAAPLAGQLVTIKYRTGGGVSGRIGSGQINTSTSVAPNSTFSLVSVQLQNLSPSSGGTDIESLDHAKQRAPQQFATHESITTDVDYASVAATFTHPVFGAVAKALATVRTSLNANIVEFYVLALGENGQLVLPSAGLKKGLTTYVDNLNVLTDEVRVLDGAIFPVDVDMTVAVSKTVDAAVVKANVEVALGDFFDAARWEMGQPFYVSNLIEAINAVDGVAYVNMHIPSGNILQQLPDESTGIASNQVVVQGSITANYYYAK